MAQYFTADEMNKLQAAGQKPFDEAFNDVASVMTNNTKLPPEVKVVFSDPELSNMVKDMMKDAQDPTVPEQMKMMKLMQSAQKLDMRLREKMNGNGNNKGPINPGGPGFTL